MPTAKEAGAFFGALMAVIWIPFYIVSLIVSEPRAHRAGLHHFPFTRPGPLCSGTASGPSPFSESCGVIAELFSPSGSSPCASRSNLSATGQPIRQASVDHEHLPSAGPALERSAAHRQGMTGAGKIGLVRSAPGRTRVDGPVPQVVMADAAATSHPEIEPSSRCIRTPSSPDLAGLPGVPASTPPASTGTRPST